MSRIPLNVARTLPRTIGKQPAPLPSDFHPTDADVRSLYRALWRQASLSVMYARQPRGYLLRKIREGLDEAKEQYPTWDQQQVIDRWERALNTKFLFEIASCKFGIEHRVISNLCTIGIEREAGTSRIPNPQLLRQRKEAEEDYKQLIQRLNNSMRLCLRT